MVMEKADNVETVMAKIVEKTDVMVVVKVRGAVDSVDVEQEGVTKTIRIMSNDLCSNRTTSICSNFRRSSRILLASI